jgi:hypothetical protein
MNPNERGHYPIAPLGVELGLWQGSYQNQTQLWLRWWDEQGELLLIGDERAELERQRAEQAEQARQQAELAQQAEAQARRDAIPRLLELGLSVEQVAAALGFSVEEVRRFI